MKRPIWSGKYFLIFALTSFLFSCGIEQYYYLPQLSQGNIQLISNNEATVIIPPIDNYYYAKNYSIYYKIYISNENFSIIDSSTIPRINPILSSDTNAIYSSTNPTNTSSTTPANTLFKGRNFFELELSGKDIKDILSTSGGTLILRFYAVSSTENQASHVIFNNSNPIFMKRSSDLVSPKGDNIIYSNNSKSEQHFLFINSNELNDQANANVNANADVVIGNSNNNSDRYAYVSMYIAAVGTNADFSNIYSKPTHIGIFKLPDK